jgi:two-component system cell cycle sensor histidine kinase/response regulator CckA
MLETILIAEDEQTNKNLFISILKREGYKVLDADSAAEARRKWDGHPERIGLLVANVTMPRKSGTELALELFNLDPQLKVLFTSGTPKDQLNESDLQNLSKLPAASFSFLGKPFLPVEMKRKVRELLAAAKTRTAI